MRLIVIGLALLAATVTMTSCAVGQAPGSADPLGLASVGLVIPFFSSPGNVSSLEIASPVGGNGDGGGNPLLVVFYTADCTRSGDLLLVPVSRNGILVINPSLAAHINFDGLLVIAGTVDDLTSVPLSSPIHARVRWTNAAENFVRTLDPITVMNAEGASNQTWNPLRTAATFIVPRQGLTIASNGRRAFRGDNESTLYLICPSPAIIERIPAAPGLTPPSAGGIGGVVYDANENFLTDWHIPCSCLTKVRVQDLSPVYSSPASTEYYTEMFGLFAGSFTGYVGTESGPFRGDHSDDFTRLRNGNYQNILGIKSGGGIDTVDR